MEWEYNLYSNYRKRKNKVATDWFMEKGFKVKDKYSYILDKKENWRNNILLNSVYTYIENEKANAKKDNRPFPIHGFIHHGLSSQAMLFNLFGESVINKDINLFQELFNFKDVYINDDSSISFEYCDRKTFNEVQQQPTSFDFAIKNKTGKNIFLEAKLVETEFGKCTTIEKGECDGQNPINPSSLCYLTYKKRTYWDLMNKYKLQIPYKESLICPLAVYYQFFRELIFALENNGYYVLLVDKENPAFKKGVQGNERGLIPTLTRYLPSEIKSIIKVIFIQDVLKIFEKNNYKWIDDFKKKYGIN